MKFKCNDCEKWIDKKDVFIEFVHAGMVGTSIYAFCKKCKNNLEKSGD